MSYKLSKFSWDLSHGSAKKESRTCHCTVPPSSSHDRRHLPCNLLHLPPIIVQFAAHISDMHGMEDMRHRTIMERYTTAVQQAMFWYHTTALSSANDAFNLGLAWPGEHAIKLQAGPRCRFASAWLLILGRQSS